ncbi:NAD(P)-binding protein, partial [Streptomyces sp. DSM 41979]
MSTRQIVIAGAGIGGLTTALTLHARGFHVTILESAHELRALGVGINLLPHAVRELTDLGLGEALLAISATPAVIDFYRSDGALLFREPRGIEGGYGYPQCSVHRGRLQMLLLDAVRSRLGTDAVRTGAAVTGFEESDDHVR